MSAIGRARWCLTLPAAALLLAAATIGAAPQAGAAPASAGRYAVEFRARSGGIFGHTYIAYGELDAGGRLHRPRYAGFYPSGILEDTPLLAVLATPSLVSLKPRDRTVRSDMVYRREISARMYAALPAEIRALRQERPLWHLTLYNCNSFVADVAEWMRLRVPTTLQLPKDFVRELYSLNRRSAPGLAYAEATTDGRVAPSPDMLFLRVTGSESIDR